MLRYKIVKQRNALDKDKKEMYYPRLTKRYKYTLRDIAQHISDQSSLSRADIMAVLISLEEVIPKMLKNGRTVSLGDLGSFSLQAHAATSPSEEEVTWRSFKELKARFRPGSALKIHLSSVNFKKA
jgi:predicted histone-like DNA-binding protein